MAAKNNASEKDALSDVEVANPPEDSISELAFSPTTNHLAVASWDAKLRIYEVSPTGVSKPVTWIECPKPVLTCCWSKDSSKVAAAGIDNVVKVMDVATSQVVEVGKHDAAISRIRMIEVGGTPILATGSWDKTVKYWDFRSPEPSGTLVCQERVYAMDASKDRLVVGTAGRDLDVIKTDDPLRMYSQATLVDTVKGQLRDIACLTDNSGYAAVATGGKCRIEYFNDARAQDSYSFVCQRKFHQANTQPPDYYSANSVCVHPGGKICATGGSNGVYAFWNYVTKQRVSMFPEVGESITSTAYDSSGKIFAYGVSYDWSRGFSGHRQNGTVKIMLHPVADEEKAPSGPAVIKPLPNWRR
ncbi:MAG: hypothetical protein M1828_005063 [Chrysothrix sp. TS-e1954]|nr:MAG: hypothetical protein M1828_005063 [Chrysothrix sp. TS-e1954]